MHSDGALQAETTRTYLSYSCSPPCAKSRNSASTLANRSKLIWRTRQIEPNSNLTLRKTLSSRRTYKRSLTDLTRIRTANWTIRSARTFTKHFAISLCKSLLVVNLMISGTGFRMTTKLILRCCTKKYNSKSKSATLLSLFYPWSNNFSPTLSVGW